MHFNSRALVLVAALSACAAAEDGKSQPAAVERTDQKDATDSVELLRERADYAALDRAAVEALARAAQAEWTGEFAAFTYARVEHFAAGGASHWISIWVHDRTGLEFVLLPGGTFRMGSPEDEVGRQADELQNWVTLDPFLIARTECTQRAWAKLAIEAGVDPDPSRFEGSDLLPVSSVSLPDMQSWCRAAHSSLPTEAQWEFACRGGTTSAWAMGDDKRELVRFANLGSADCPPDWIDREIDITETWHDGYGDALSVAGSFSANSFGLFDVHGNVREWCRDAYVGYEVPAANGTGLRAGRSQLAVARGGSFNGSARIARSADRNSGEGIVHRHFGFRPCVDLPCADSSLGR